MPNHAAGVKDAQRAINKALAPKKRRMKLTADRPFADPEKAARKLLELANAIEAVQDGHLH